MGIQHDSYENRKVYLGSVIIDLSWVPNKVQKVYLGSVIIDLSWVPNNVQRTKSIFEV